MTSLNIGESVYLEFQSHFDIEENYDYGYVEVHDLTTGEWYTLEGVATVQNLPNSYGYDNPNCPDVFEPTRYFDKGRWNAFTGSSYGWYQEKIDLSDFAGHIIEIYFTYWTDPYTLELGWYIDDVEIPEIGFSDDFEGGTGDWEVNAGWEYTDGIVIPWNDFEVYFINTIYIFKRNGDLWRAFIYIKSMGLKHNTEEGHKLLVMQKSNRIMTFTAMVIANQPGTEHTFGTYYYFIAQEKSWHWKH